ncbi:MAG: sigma-70 family RNA polymerase sigma factor [Kitasatospora sp.]|jgi:RNA polymerase sigma-70 factor (ECF subfamily)|nr:sigma-70 family RNA polymerase sigma factor [Kitasatospora sp.]
MAEKLANEDVPQRADPYRRELLAHCYRMLGSVHDAEDLVQETYLRAWKAYDRFEGRSSLRTWLHSIATRACLTALESRSKRPLPTGLGAPSGDPHESVLGTEQKEVPWLEPMPDNLLEGADPSDVVASRQTIRLAFIAALQHLPPKQRAVLILRDVLKWKAAEVAELLDTTTASVNSALQRAHAAIDKIAPSEDSVTEPTDAEQRALLDRWTAAFEAKDIDAIVQLFAKDAVWEMPPFPGWYEGPEAIGVLIDTQCPAGHGDMRVVPSAANGQLAVGLYLRSKGETGDFLPWQYHVIEQGPDGVTHCAAFFGKQAFESAGLPEFVPADEPRR